MNLSTIQSGSVKEEKDVIQCIQHIPQHIEIAVCNLLITIAFIGNQMSVLCSFLLKHTIKQVFTICADILPDQPS